MRRYKLIIITAIIVFLTMISYGFCADVAKIGILDGQRVLETSDAGQAARNQIKKRYSRMEEELKKRNAEFEEQKSQFDRNAMVMSQEKREQSQRDLQIKKMDLQQMSKKYTGELKQMEQKLLSKINDDVKKIVQEIGKSEGYLVIIDRAAAPYYPTSIDITDKLIKKYNAQYAKGQKKSSKKE